MKAFRCFNKLLSRLYEMTWYVHIGAAWLDPRATVRCIGRYTKRAVLAEYRITHYDKKMVRYAGLFAPRWKAGYLAQAHVAPARENKAATKSAAESEPAKASLLPWRQRRVVHGAADPRLCPFCQVERQLIELASGSHGMIARYFEKAQRAIAPFHPVWQPVPG